jgi:cytochrome c oxidase subunit IV
MKALRPYVIPFLALLVLVALTAAGSYIPLGTGNFVLAMAVAVTKTALVVLFFMDLREEDTLLRLVALVGVVWLGFLLMLELTDTLSRFPGHLLG